MRLKTIAQVSVLTSLVVAAAQAYANWALVVSLVSAAGLSLWAWWEWSTQFGYLPVVLTALVTFTTVLWAVIGARAVLHPPVQGTSSLGATAPPVGGAPSEPPTRHYSTNDKDRISELLFELAEMLRKQAGALRDTLRLAVKEWDQNRGLELSAAIEAATSRADSADKSAADIKAAVVGLREKYGAYRSIVDDAIAYRQPSGGVVSYPAPHEPGPVHNAQMAVRDYKGCLEGARALDGRLPNYKDPVYAMMPPMIRRLSDVCSELETWKSGCENRVKELEPKET